MSILLEDILLILTSPLVEETVDPMSDFLLPKLDIFITGCEGEEPALEDVGDILGLILRLASSDERDEEDETSPIEPIIGGGIIADSEQMFDELT